MFPIKGKKAFIALLKMVGTVIDHGIMPMANLLRYYQYSSNGFHIG